MLTWLFIKDNIYLSIILLCLHVLIRIKHYVQQRPSYWPHTPCVFLKNRGSTGLNLVGSEHAIHSILTGDLHPVAVIGTGSVPSDCGLSWTCLLLHLQINYSNHRQIIFRLIIFISQYYLTTQTLSWIKEVSFLNSCDLGVWRLFHTSSVNTCSNMWTWIKANSGGFYTKHGLGRMKIKNVLTSLCNIDCL